MSAGIEPFETTVDRRETGYCAFQMLRLVDQQKRTYRPPVALDFEEDPVDHVEWDWDDGAARDHPADDRRPVRIHVVVELRRLVRDDRQDEQRLRDGTRFVQLISKESAGHHRLCTE